MARRCGGKANPCVTWNPEARRTRISRSSSSRRVFSLSSCWSRELRAQRCSAITSCNIRARPVPLEAHRSGASSPPQGVAESPPSFPRRQLGSHSGSNSTRQRVGGQSRGSPLPGHPLLIFIPWGSGQVWDLVTDDNGMVRNSKQRK